MATTIMFVPPALPSRHVSLHQMHPRLPLPSPALHAQQSPAHRLPSHLCSTVPAFPVADAAISVSAFRFAGLRHSFHLVLAFLSGVLFISVLNTFATIGKENIGRGWDLFKIVMGRVWTIFTYGLGTAWETLYEGKRWRPQFRAFWRVFKEQMTLTRKAAVEGIEAIKLEASLYNDAIGPTNMVLAQYALDNMTPKLLANMAMENLQRALGEVKNPNIRRIELESFKFGSQGPKLVSGRTYDLRKDNAMAIDFDVNWESADGEANIRLVPKMLGVNKRKDRVSVPVTIKNFKFHGVVRVILTPLTDTPPGFGAALVSFPKSPAIGLDCMLSKVEITRAPWLKTELLKEIQKSISNQFLWPRRIVLPSAVVPKPITPSLSRLELEQLKVSDPLLKAEKIIDSNELIVKTNLVRDAANETEVFEKMDIFVGDERDRLERLWQKQGNSTATNGTQTNRRGIMRFPWQRMRGENVTHFRASAQPFRFPWQNNATRIGDADQTQGPFPWQ